VLTAYLTHDEGNAAVARRIARRLGLELTVLAVTDAGLAARAELLVLDLDHLPADCRSGLIRQARRGRLAVHAGHLTAPEARARRAAGARLARRRPPA
jgi:hypothetical protein